MTGQPPESSSASRTSAVPHPALDPVSPALFQHRQFWLRLAAYRPLLVLGGMWILLMAIALVAYNRLVYTGSQPAPSSAPAPAQGRTATSGAETSPNLADSPELGTENSTINTSVAEDPGLSGWSIAALVVLCAGGCFVISQQVQAPPRARSKPRRRPVEPPPARPAPVAATKAPPKRLEPYNAFTALRSPNPPLRNPITASSASRANPTPASTAATTAMTATTTEATVVPPHATTPVDWPEGSLVNTVDVRQRRSLSSFL
ncbi:hypothetical protein [Leptolyngbya sp. PCC 6406]|uniref:hypothetical protein n=1 Tax=Leptolyngbya sp. PCC 6406 TaxID=1173264 RepID=UPI0002AC5E5A|nr:hypothetical protein [Leptolyngbya sp. PCC 6406]